MENITNFDYATICCMWTAAGINLISIALNFYFSHRAISSWEESVRKSARLDFLISALRKMKESMEEDKEDCNA